MILVDTNVLIDIAGNDPQWSGWSRRALTLAQGEFGPAAVNAVVYAEFSLGFGTKDCCDAELDLLGVVIEPLPIAAAFRAGVAFREYRRLGGARSSLLPDFFIGAHASILSAPLLTRDAARYRTYFPEVELIAPERR